MLFVRSLTLYPVKGIRGVSVQEAAVEPRGLGGDRRWMLVDPAGCFLSQRTVPGLVHLSGVPQSDRGLLLEAPGMPPLTVAEPKEGSARRTVRIWKDAVSVVEAGAEADDWCSRSLGRRVHLIYMDRDARRPIDPAYDDAERTVSFADGFPILLACPASLDDLNARLDEPLEMRRFRPNIEIGGGEAFDEDCWLEVRIGGVGLEVVKPCKRCVVTTLDPETGVAGREPLRTLASYRRRGRGVYFGQNAIPRGGGILRVGDAVEVTARREAPWFP